MPVEIARAVAIRTTEVLVAAFRWREQAAIVIVAPEWTIGVTLR